MAKPSTYNKYPCRCSSCRRPLARGEGVLCGTVSEYGGWIVTCRRGIGCGPKVAEKPKPSKKDAEIEWIGPTEGVAAFLRRLLSAHTEDDLRRRGFDVDLMHKKLAEAEKAA